MSKFIIASVLGQNGNNWDILGYKVYNTVNKEFELLSENTIKNHKLRLENAEFVDGKLKGTMGDLKRYTQLNAFDGYAINGISMVILGKDSEGYYLIIENPELDEKLVRRVSPYELKRQIKISNGNVEGVRVANARVENPDNIKTMVVKPIVGHFSIIEQCPMFIEKDFDFGAKQGNHSCKWKVRIVRNGDFYGRDYCLVNKKEALIEFYDLDEDPEKFPIGQMVSSYYLESIKGKKGALMLNGNSEKWYLTSESMDLIQEWLNTVSV